MHEGAILVNSLKMLERAGYEFVVTDADGGVAIRIEGLRTAESLSGGLAFEGVSGDAPLPP